MTNEEFERFREHSVEQMARFFSALEEDRRRAEEDRRRNEEDHRQIRAELRAAVREGMRYVRESRRDRQAFIDNDLRLQARLDQLGDKLQAFIDSMRRGGNGQ